MEQPQRTCQIPCSSVTPEAYYRQAAATPLVAEDLTSFSILSNFFTATSLSCDIHLAR